MINAQEIQGHWNQLQGKVKQKWGHLTDDDLRIVGGNVEQLVGRLQQKTGETRANIEEYLSSLVDDASPMIQQATERLREGYDQASDYARDAYQGATSVVQRRPAESLGVVLCAGLLTGAIVGLLMHNSSGDSWCHWS